MEKLQPLITHRFWVLFGLGILVPLISWFIYNGSINETIEGRRNDVETAFSTAQKGADAPNQNWVKAAEKVNDGHAEQLERASQKLWLDQQDATSMFWPKRMQPYVRTLGYRQPLEGPQSSGALTIYKREYDRQHETKVLSRITQYEEGKGLMEVNEPMIHRVPEGAWQGRLPTWTEVWDAQEDAWLVAQLLESLENVNKKAGARTIAEAPVRQLIELKLMGGNLDEKKKKAGGASDSGYSDMVGGGFDPGKGLVGAGGSGGGAGGLSEGGMAGAGASSAKSAIASPDVDFDETEEFGSPAGTGGGGAGLNMDDGYPGAGGGTTGKKATGPRRYVHDKEDKPYRTRGFKIRLTIQQDSLPTVLAELTNSDWPVEIVRVHWEAANEHGRTASSVSSQSSGLGKGTGLAGSGLAGSGGGGFSGFGGTGGGGGGYDDIAGGEKESDFQDNDADGYGGSGYPGAGGGNALAGSGGSTATTPEPEEAADPLEAALRDPYLSTVVIAGLITIFKVDEEEAAKMKELLKQKTAAETTPTLDADNGDDSETPATDAATDADADADGVTTPDTNESTPDAGADRTAPPADSSPPADPAADTQNSGAG